MALPRLVRARDERRSGEPLALMLTVLGDRLADQQQRVHVGRRLTLASLPGRPGRVCRRVAG
jgi:hypothetical protein